MTRGEEIALTAMKKELKSLSKRAVLAKNKTESCINAASTIINCRIEAGKVLKSEKSLDEQMKLISVLADKEKAAFKVNFYRKGDVWNKLYWSALSGGYATPLVTYD